MPRKCFKMKGGNTLSSSRVGNLIKGQSGSSYQKYDDIIFLSVMMAISIVGMVWFFISRSLITHKYSETLSYGLMGGGVFISLLLILFKSVRNIKPSNEGSGFIQNIITLLKKFIMNGFPGILILIQVIIISIIMYIHADYIYASEKPAEFNTFNILSMFMILIQIYVWNNQVKRLILGGKDYTNTLQKEAGDLAKWFAICGFIIAAIISGVSISQIYVILEYLKTDC